MPVVKISIRLELEKIILFMDGHKLAATFSSGEYEISFNKGISREGEMLDLGVRASEKMFYPNWLDYEHVFCVTKRSHIFQYARLPVP